MRTPKTFNEKILEAAVAGTIIMASSTLIQAEATVYGGVGWYPVLRRH
jgi:hypothetical protein